jgi:hypothetical protein
MIRGLKKREKDNYKRIDDNLYASLFGLNNPEKDDLHKAAFKKAWEARNFEIDKFWQRSAFFWGFIVIIFGGYISVVTGYFYETARGMYLDYYLILLGIIFSVAWFLVILGSKRWQENWEQHICYLEDEITGPLYKTIYYYKGNNYYSVSRINKILACLILLSFISLFFFYLYNNCFIIKNIFINNISQAFICLLLPFIGTVSFIYVIIKFGHSYGRKFKSALKKGENSAFFNIN